MGGMKPVQGWAIRDANPPFHHWPSAMPFPQLFLHKTEADEKAKQLTGAGYFQAFVVPIELHELKAYPVGEGCPKGFGNEIQAR